MIRKKRKKKKHNVFPKVLITLFLCLIAFVIGTKYAALNSMYDQFPKLVKEEINKIKKLSGTIQKTTKIVKYEDLSIPARLYDREEQLIHHTGYSVSYNENWRLPNWAGYELTHKKVKGTEPRARHFKPNPQIIGISATNNDYSRSGYDRGHMVPAGDMKWSKKAMQESFYYSNICPQSHHLNAGNWKKLEEKVRSWAIRDSAIIVVCGPIVNKKPMRIGVNKVAVPDAFFKVILSPYISSPQGIGFIMKHEKSSKNLRSYAVTIDSVENITGIDFFHVLPDDLEHRIESQISLKSWGL